MTSMYFKLRFEKPDMRGRKGNAWIVAGDSIQDRQEDGDILFTSHAVGISELEHEVRIMKGELDAILAAARTKFGP